MSDSLDRRDFLKTSCALASVALAAPEDSRLGVLRDGLMRIGDGSGWGSTNANAAAIQALAPLVIGRTLESFTSDMRAFWRHITGDSQLRWIGPEKGVIHLATAAVVNRSSSGPLMKAAVPLEQLTLSSWEQARSQRPE